MIGLLDGAQVERVFFARPVETWLLVALGVGALAWTGLMYARRGGLPRWLRATLAGLRLVTLLLIIALAFEPTATVAETLSEARQLAVLVDVSESMAIRDPRRRAEDIGQAGVALGIVPPGGSIDEVRQRGAAINGKRRETIDAASRLDLVKGLLTAPAGRALDSLAEDLDLRYYAFGESLRPLGSADDVQALQAHDAESSLAGALDEVAQSAKPVAAVVLLSDGLETSSRRAEAAAQSLGLRGIPIHTLPVGVADPDDVAIRGVVMQDVAFTGDRVPVRVQLQSKGYERRTADLSVSLDGRRVASRTVSFDGGVQFEEVFFNVDVAEKGAARITIEVTPFTDEATASNNRVERSVRVVNEKINVLCIEGSARWEFRYLRAMLKRDPRINATFIATRAQPELAQSSSEYVAEFPEDREEAFGYDLVILGDVDSSFFSAQALQRLEELIRERGGSLLMLCGARFAPSSYAGTPVERMLPIEFDAEGAYEDVDAGVHPVLTPEGRSSLVMTLESDPEENDLVWSRVAPLDRVPPLGEPRLGATVLAELSETRSRSSRYPLVAWQRYGTGKCMMIATDRLWLLRFKTGDKYHWRVWSQCVQFLTLSRLMGEHKRIRLETDRATYPLDGRVMLYAQVLDGEFEPVAQPGFDVVVDALDGASEPQSVTLRPDASKPGLYEGYFSPPRTGGYRVQADEADRSLANSTEFQVADLRPELTVTDAQLDRLQRIAELSDGRCLAFHEIAELSGLVDRSRHTTTVRSDRSLWDNLAVASLLALLLGVEWILRRKYDLR